MLEYEEIGQRKMIWSTIPLGALLALWKEWTTDALNERMTLHISYKFRGLNQLAMQCNLQDVSDIDSWIGFFGISTRIYRE